MNDESLKQDMIDFLNSSTGDVMPPDADATEWHVGIMMGMVHERDASRDQQIALAALQFSLDAYPAINTENVAIGIDGREQMTIGAWPVLQARREIGRRIDEIKQAQDNKQ